MMAHLQNDQPSIAICKQKPIKHCPVCGRPVKGGPLKQKHRECSFFEFALSQLKRYLERIHFEDEKHKKKVHGDCFAVVNQCFRPKGAVKYAQGDDRETEEFFKC